MRGPFAYGPNEIPDNHMPESRSLVMLRQEGRRLLNALNGLRNPALQQRGAAFCTHRGEAGLVRSNNEGGAQILVNGKEVFSCFDDSFYPGSTHVMMATPTGQMAAGRFLPPNYIAEAGRLVNGAINAIDRPGHAQAIGRRWSV